MNFYKDFKLLINQNLSKKGLFVKIDSDISSYTICIFISKDEDAK